MGSWFQNHWKGLAVLAVSAIVFTAVTVLTGGLGAPLLVALAAGGFSSGVAGYVTGQLLDDKPVDPKQVLIQGTVSAVVTVGTFGVARAVAPVIAPIVSRAVPEVVTSVVPQAIRTGAANATVGATFGSGLQVAENAIRGRPLGENVGDAAQMGALNGVLAAPIGGFTQRIMGVGSTPVIDSYRVSGYSPSLLQDMAALEAQGWKFQYGKPYKGTFCDYNNKTIVVDPTNTSLLRALGRKESAAAELTDSLAHEVGHAMDGVPRYTPATAVPTREAYVEANVRPYLDSEGAAALNENVVKNEILANGGPTISGSTTGKYARIANDSSLTRDEKVRALGDLYASNTPSTEGFWKIMTNRARNYEQMYGDHFAEHWDKVYPSGKPSSSQGFVKGLDKLGD